MVRRGEKDKLRFFKVMVDENYGEILYLPPMIAKKVEHVIGQETEIEDTKGDRWPVSVSKVDDGLAFEEGWQKFSSDHRLKRGEVLVFKYIWGSHFVVRVFGLSACDRENFNDRPSKKLRRGTAVEEEPFQTINIDSEDNPVLDTPDEVGRSPEPMDIVEVIDCMIKKEDGFYQGEDRTIWGDLSIFEQGISSVPDPNKSHDVSKSQSEFSEQVGDDVQMGDVYTRQIEGHSGNDLTHKLEDHPLYTKLAPSQSDIVDKTKRHDAETVIQTNQVKGHSGISTDKFKKAVETKTIPFDLEITKKVIGKKDDTQTAAIHSRQTATKHFKNQPENSNLRKGMPDVSNSKDGSSKIRQGVFEEKIRAHEFSVPSSFGKDPSGKRAVKKEMMEMEDETSHFPRAFCGKEPTMVDKSGKMKVKDEPQSHDDFCSRPVAFIPFSAEVKSTLYLELPESFHGRQRNKSGKIVYLRDSERRLWPLLYLEKPGVKSLSLNWTNFCRGNNIKLGDECRFQFENETPCIVQVQVIPGPGEVKVPHK